MTNQEEVRIRNEIKSCLGRNNVSSLKDFIEAELDGLIEDIYGQDETDDTEFSSDYLVQIDKVLRNGPPFSDEQMEEIVDIIVPIIVTHDLAGK
ncbi:hypothetical protein DUG83_24335 [Vibrio parahaemolyticus]|uniref:Uncharacterized protein n=2 Tax=Vibrio TaxID=662 RepID=A0AAW4BH62_VIBAN|nr:MULTISPECIES: hypothetical protein [Vibrio]EGR2724539.1 hypothetical protein [Vibrio parahaemolyticus]ASG09283.1 hypothetical protein CEQ50_17530 [Vibrio anguillarum]ELB2249964.1 hypothetical protein [Vibrio parahaemolyticus]MBF4436407.1 hypothetical protein [Vibrio anguillarum]OEE41550.1 hypothetical protein A1QS_02125 [Vibrio ordalii FS-238]